jgi:hypothetical protein
MDYTTSIFDEIGLAIYGMVKNTLTLICWRLLLKPYTISSPYTIKFGALVIAPKIFFTKLQMIFFYIMFLFSNPQILAELYTKQ